MRHALVIASLVALAGCASPDPMLGTFTFALTGTDTQTAPNNSSQGVAGSGVLAVTTSKNENVDYVVTAAQNDVGPCVLNFSRNDKGDALTMAAGQSCTFNYAGGQVTASMSTGTVSLDDARENMTLTVTYSFSGQTFGFNFAGTGTRTYTGPRR